VGALLGLDYPGFLCGAHAAAHCSSFPPRKAYVLERASGGAEQGEEDASTQPVVAASGGGGRSPCKTGRAGVQHAIIHRALHSIQSCTIQYTAYTITLIRHTLIHCAHTLCSYTTHSAHTPHTLLIHHTPYSYTTHHTPYTILIHHTLYSTHHTPHTMLHTPYSIHYTHTLCSYTTHSAHTPYTTHHTPYTILHTPYSTHYAPHTILHTMLHTMLLPGGGSTEQQTLSVHTMTAQERRHHALSSRQAQQLQQLLQQPKVAELQNGVAVLVLGRQQVRAEWSSGACARQTAGACLMRAASALASQRILNGHCNGHCNGHFSSPPSPLPPRHLCVSCVHSIPL
jgi:hypothetical protein